MIRAMDLEAATHEHKRDMRSFSGRAMASNLDVSYEGLRVWASANYAPSVRSEVLDAVLIGIRLGRAQETPS